jgi:hypothetical protein
VVKRQVDDILIRNEWKRFRDIFEVTLVAIQPGYSSAAAALFSLSTDLSGPWLVADRADNVAGRRAGLSAWGTGDDGSRRWGKYQGGGESETVQWQRSVKPP